MSKEKPIVNNIEESWNNGYLAGVKEAESQECKTHFILLTTTEKTEVAVNVEQICAIYEHGEYRSLMFSFDGDYIRVKESLGEILTLVGFPR